MISDEVKSRIQVVGRQVFTVKFFRVCCMFEDFCRIDEK